MNIPFFNYPALFQAHRIEIMKVIEDVLSRGAYVMQRDLETFEHNLANYLGVKHVIGVADGTVALMMALRASGIKQGDEVLVPSHTFVASAASIHHVGATPILVDCASDHLIDAKDLEHRITKRTAAIMPVQLNGRTANMNEVVHLAKKYNLTIIEDSAQALGSKFQGKFAGTFGSAGTCSFFPSKTLGCFGDGGAVITDDDDVADRVKLLRDHGRSNNGDVVTWGYNARLDNLQAAILNYKLAHYNNEIFRRRELASLYHQHLNCNQQVLLPPPPSLNVEHYDIFQNYEIEAERRDDLRIYLEQHGVKTIIQWGGKCIHQFHELRLNSDLPYTEAMTRKYMLLPMNTSLSDQEVVYICEKINSFYR